MAEKPQKKKFAPVIAADDSTQEQPEQVVQSGEPTAQVDAQPAAESTSKGSRPAVESTPEAPYSEYGGLAQTLSQRKETASRRREEAAQEWERRLSEQSNARLALVNAVKPENTSRKQRSLRNQAIGQAAGELIGALFGGIYGLGKQGRGYVPKMPGLYRNTLAKMQQLEDNDIAAQQKFRGMLGGVQERDAADRVAMAQNQYQDAAAEEKQIRTEEYYADREAFRAENRRDSSAQKTEARRELGDTQAEQRRELQQERHKQRLEEQRNAATLKGTAGGMDSGDIAYVTKLLLPQTRTSTTSGGKVPTTTVRDVSSYNKQEVAAATALAKQVAPIVRQYNLSDKEVVYLNKLTGKYAIKWDQIAALLKEVSVDDISAYLSDNGME